MFGLCERAVLVSMFHSRPIQIYDIPKKKNGYLDTKVVTDVCAYGIYPDLARLEAVSSGETREDLTPLLTPSIPQVRPLTSSPGIWTRSW